MRQQAGADRYNAIMPLSDLSPLTYFKELQFLPRVIFTIGGFLFIGGLTIGDVALIFFGIGIIFCAVFLNFVFEMRSFHPHPPYNWYIKWGSVLQGLLAAVIAAGCLYLGGYRYLHGTFPSRLLPDHQIESHKPHASLGQFEASTRIERNGKR